MLQNTDIKEADNKKVVVEVFTASGCGGCQRAKTLAEEVTAKLTDKTVQYREVSVLEDIDYAVQLGVERIPSIAIAGELVFSGLPTAISLRQAILERLNCSCNSD